MNVLRLLLILTVLILFSCQTHIPSSSVNADSKTSQADKSPASAKTIDESTAEQGPSQSDTPLVAEKPADRPKTASKPPEPDRPLSSPGIEKPHSLPEDTPSADSINGYPSAASDSSQETAAANAAESSSPSDDSTNRLVTMNNQADAPPSIASNESTEGHSQPETEASSASALPKTTEARNSTQSEEPSPTTDSSYGLAVVQPHAQAQITSAAADPSKNALSESSSSGAQESSPSADSEKDGISPKDGTILIRPQSDRFNNGTTIEMDPAQQEEIEDIYQVIMELNWVIASRNYNRWLDRLTESYKDKFTSPDTLKMISEFPKLAFRSISLRTLKDYFHLVVVPSHSSTFFSHIEMLEDNRVVVYTSFKGQRAKLYQLVKVENSWKIAEW